MRLRCARSRRCTLLAQQVRWLDITHNVDTIVHASILFNSAVEPASLLLFLCEHLLQARDAELLTGFDGAIVLLRDNIFQAIFVMTLHPLVQDSCWASTT